MKNIPSNKTKYIKVKNKLDDLEKMLKQYQQNDSQKI